MRRHIYHLIEMLVVFGPQLGRPQVDTLKGSRHTNMKELRFHADSGAWRVAFAFDLKRRAVLLVGADKAGVSQSKFYRDLIEIADRRFAMHQAATSKGQREQWEFHTNKFLPWNRESFSCRSSGGQLN